MKRLLALSVVLLVSFTIQENTGSKFTAWQAGHFTESHNELRYTIFTPYNRLEWNTDIAVSAQEWADYLKNNGGKLQHRPKKGKYAVKYGENLALIPLTKDKNFLDKAVTMWFEEIDNDFITGSLKNALTKQTAQKYGHGLQVLWQNTKRIGAGYADLGNGYAIVVCNYDPPGNIIGKKASDGIEQPK